MSEIKDFDTERRAAREERAALLGDRKFLLGGEEFTYRPYVSYTVLQEIAGTGDLDGAELIAATERAILELIEPDQEERFLAVARSKDDPLSYSDLNALAFWLTEAQAGRPTLASPPSTDGDAKTKTSSTDD